MPTRKWGFEKLVNTTLTDHQLTSSIAGLAGGGYVVVWVDLGGAFNAIRGQRFDAAGNKAGAEIAIAVAAGNDRDMPSVTALADGGFHVAYTMHTGSDNYILGSVYNANGAFVRSQDVVFAFGLDTDVNTARLGTGMVAAWEDPDGKDILYRVFDASGAGGAVLTANNSAFPNPERDPSVAAAPDGSKFAIVWKGVGNIFWSGRLFNASGAAATASEFTADIALNVDGTEQPSIAWLGNTAFVVAWREHHYGDDSNDSFIRVQVFGTAGTGSGVVPLTGTITANSTLPGLQQSPVITALPSGGFVVSWEDYSGIGGDGSAAIRLQAFDGAGGKIGGEILVNTNTNLVQAEPSISALADGRVAVSWTDESSGSDYDIRTQIVDPRDGIVTGTPGADTLYGHDLVNDEISGFAGADTLYGLKGNNGLYGGGDADLLMGGFGDDVVFAGAGNDLLQGDAGADELNGEAGIDTASYNGALSPIVAALDGSLAGTNNALGDTFSGVENLIGTNLAGPGDTLRGDALINTLNGLNGIDTLQGLAGNDTLIGGLGADSLTGAAGDDRHLYGSPAEGGDTIFGFSSAAAGNNDSFWFAGAAFAGLPAGPLAAIRFQSSVANVAANANVRFFHETDTGILRFDADGSGAGAAVVIATLSGLPVVALSDFMIF